MGSVLDKDHGRRSHALIPWKGELGKMFGKPWLFLRLFKLGVKTTLYYRVEYILFVYNIYI